MRIITLSKCLEFEHINLVAGRSYVATEKHEEQLATLGAVKHSVPVEAQLRMYKGENLNGKTLLTWRTGGIGDILMLSPALAELKLKYPFATIKAGSMFPQPFENHPAIHRSFQMPFDAEELDRADYHLHYQGLLESGTEAGKTTPAVDLFMQAMGINPAEVPPARKRPVIKLSAKEFEWVAKTKAALKIKDHLVAGIQAEASSPIRKFPKEKMQVIAHTLVSEGFKVIVVGGPDQKPLYDYLKANGNPENIIDGTRFSIRQSLILASIYDLIIAPDSFLVQVGAAYNIPTIGLYGPFPSKIRMQYHTRSIGLDARVVCSPCCIHDFKPCVKGFPSPCFTQISEKDILEACDYLMFPKLNRHFKCLVPELTPCPQK